MRQLLLGLLVAVPSVAFAQDPPAGMPAPVMIQPPPPAPTTTGPADGWQFQARMSTGIGVDSIISPGFSIGHRADGLTIAAEIGLTGGKFATDNGAGSTNTTSVMLYSIMPMAYLDVWKSPDGRARFNILAGVGYGHGTVTADSNDGMGGTSHTESTVTFAPLLGGIGGDYFLSPNFGLGIELSAEVPLLLSVQSNGMDQHVSGQLESLHGLLRATFIIGQ
jgi:hypothetical protein